MIHSIFPMIFVLGLVVASAAGCGEPSDATPEPPLGDSDASHTGDHDPNGSDSNLTGDTETGLTGVELNTGWIGGACQSTADCDNTAFTGTPMCEEDGFANGMCTQACSQASSGRYVCPDTTGGDITTTRCVSSDAGAPRCVSECDFDQSPETGCRPGYACVLKRRFGSSSVDDIFPVCLPEETQGWPGESTPSFDIGESCANSLECGHLSCLQLPNGYCTKILCAQTGCPTGSSCVRLGEDGLTACVRDCTLDTQCRMAERYECRDDLDVCWESSTPPPHDATVGEGDCVDAWGTSGDALSRCDTTPDSYVVLNKAARNLAFCNSGVLVANFNVGLGFSPAGDKEREGDGKTPEGVFYIPRLIPNSQYYKAFLLSYPDNADADRGIAQGLISSSEAQQIRSAQTSCTEPPQATGLGGLIEIHGEHVANAGDWTWGCIAATNAQVDQMWATLELHDTIVVLP